MDLMQHHACTIVRCGNSQIHLRNYFARRPLTDIHGYPGNAFPIVVKIRYCRLMLPDSTADEKIQERRLRNLLHFYYQQSLTVAIKTWRNKYSSPHDPLQNNGLA